MSSNINFNNIDDTFPVEGIDNKSQGFRDNFIAIKEALAIAKDEIETLQETGGGGGGTQGPPGPRGLSYVVIIESTAGTVFRPGEDTMTTLIAHVFENGVEVTNDIPAVQFSWRRVSDNYADDLIWNAMHASGYKVININMGTMNSRATFFCDIVN
jgi:hypothetical protein